MRIDIPAPWSMEYIHNDGVKIRQLGGKWSPADNCWVLQQYDIEAYILMQDGWWIDMDKLIKQTENKK